MAGFDDLLDAHFEPPFNETAEKHVVGTTLSIRVSVIDGDGLDVNLATGYSAAMTPYVNGVALTTFTQTLASGRQVLLGNGFITVTATPAASAALFASYVGRVAKLTLLVTRTTDGAVAPIWVECNLPLRPKLNP